MKVESIDEGEGVQSESSLPLMSGKSTEPLLSDAMVVTHQGQRISEDGLVL